MIIEINNNNIDNLEFTFISKDTIKKELENNPFARILGLEENNKIIGYLYYSDIYDRIEINQIEVDNEMRNCGKGSFMMKHLTDSTDKDMTLEVREDNIPALKLYEKYDFKKVAIRKGYYQGIDGILMERKKDSH